MEAVFLKASPTWSASTCQHLTVWIKVSSGPWYTQQVRNGWELKNHLIEKENLKQTSMGSIDGTFKSGNPSFNGAL